MADKFSTMPPRIVQLLLMAFSHSATDGERANAMRAFDRYLASVGSDGHDVVEKIKTTPPDEAAMREQLKAEARKIFDAGYAKRVADETEQRQRSAGAIASLTTAGVVIPGARSSVIACSTSIASTTAGKPTPSSRASPHS